MNARYKHADAGCGNPHLCVRTCPPLEMNSHMAFQSSSQKKVCGDAVLIGRDGRTAPLYAARNGSDEAAVDSD